ncbi:MAG: ABC transporter ATP-binding protein [Clostridiales bacterium]|nr:ABC transporter ATP-binding protein [Clostridiales bacterium]
MEYYFSAKQMSVGYRKCPLIRNIEIGLKRGEILTLIGPNGAGKTTVLKSIAGQLALIGGVAFLGKENIQHIPDTELAQKMAVVFTDRLRTELLTCEEVVATGRYPYTGHFGILSKQDHAAVREAMEFGHVTEMKDQDFTKISDGQRQRVMLARAICQEPEIIILDEPTSYLDVRYKLEFLSILQKLKREKGLTVIMSLHELELAERVSDQILCIQGEYVDRLGTPAEIFQPSYIGKLFQIECGSYDEKSGSMELEPPEGEAEVFVIAGGGCGRNVYRKLQRQGIPFRTGILYQNDLDYPVAKALAAEVIEAEMFEPVAKALFETAKRQMDRCRRVICCKERFGSLESANRELLLYAGQSGKQVEVSYD